MINTNFKEYFEDVIVECHPVDNYDQNWLFKCEDYTLVLIDKKEGLINLGIVIEKLQFT